MKKQMDIKKLVLLAMLAALSYLAMVIMRVPVVSFLKYEPKDVVIVIGGFLFGPLSAAGISLTVSLLEMFTVSETGIIGCIMNFLSTCSFACVAALIYKKKHDQLGALAGLLIGTGFMVAVMLLWNWLITPLYLEVERSVVEGMLLPVFLPFNLLKGGLNTAIALLIYKPLVIGLRKARLVAPSRSAPARSRLGITLLAVGIALTCVICILVLQGKL